MAKRKRKSEPEEEKPTRTPVSVIRKRVKPVAELLKDKITALIYGRSGTGKTTIAATMLEFIRQTDPEARILLIDMNEEGGDSIADIDGIDMLPIRNWGDIEGAYMFLKKDKLYHGYIMDTVTQMQDFAMAEAKDRAGLAADDTMSRRAWGALSGMFIPTLIDFRNLPLHGCFIAQARRDEIDEDVDEEDLMPEMGPAVMPSVAKTLNAMVKVIGQSFIAQKEINKGGKLKRKNVFKMRVGPHQFYLTKIRSPKSFVVPQTVINPTWTKIHAIIKGETVGKKEAK